MDPKWELWEPLTPEERDPIEPAPVVNLGRLPAVVARNGLGNLKVVMEGLEEMQPQVNRGGASGHVRPGWDTESELRNGGHSKSYATTLAMGSPGITIRQRLPLTSSSREFDPGEGLGVWGTTSALRREESLILHWFWVTTPSALSTPEYKEPHRTSLLLSFPGEPGTTSRGGRRGGAERKGHALTSGRTVGEGRYQKLRVLLAEWVALRVVKWQGEDPERGN